MPVVAAEVEAVEVESEETTGDEELEGITRVDSLPEVITADMLRARKNKSVDLSEDFVIPAELLVGLEEVDDEWDEDEKPKGRGKGSKAPAKAKRPAAKPEAKAKAKGKKWRPPVDDDDDF